MDCSGFVMTTRCANFGLMIADRRSFTYRVASSTRQSNGLLIRGFGVRFPGDPPAFAHIWESRFRMKTLALIILVVVVLIFAGKILLKDPFGIYPKK